MKRLLKYFGFAFAGLLGLALALAAFTQTRWFKDWLRDKLIAASRPYLQGELQIGRISGNLISHFAITNILLSAHGDTVVYLPKLTVGLLPSRLLHHELALRVVALDSPYVRLKQLPDSTWNAASLLAASARADTAATPDTSGLDWRIVLDDASLRNGRVNLLPLVPIPALPSRVLGIDSRLALAYSDSGMTLHLRDLKLRTPAPQFAISELSTVLRLDATRLLARDLVVQTPRSRLTGTIAIHLAENPDYRLALQAAPFDCDDVRAFVPDFPIHGAPDLSITAFYQADSGQFDLVLQENGQQLALAGAVAGLNGTNRYRLRGTLGNFDSGYWLQDSLLISAINGQFRVEGQSFDPKTAIVQLTGDFRQCEISRRQFSHLVVAASYRHGTVDGSIRLAGDFGAVALDGKIADLTGKQRFDLEAKLQKIDLANLLLADSLHSAITLALSAKGSHLQLEKMQAQVALELSSSRFAEVHIDTLFCFGNLDRGNFSVDTLQLYSQLGDFFMSGRLSLESESDLRFRGDLGDLRWVKAQVGADTLRARGYFAGSVRGRPDSLVAETKYQLAGVSYETIAVDTLAGDFFMFYGADSLSGRSSTTAKQCRIAEMPIDTVSVQARFNQNDFDFLLDFVRGNEVAGKVHALFMADSLPQLIIPNVTLHIRNQTWSGGSDSMRVVLGDDYYQLHDVHLLSDSQFVRANGIVRLTGAEDLAIQLENLDLAVLSALFAGPTEIAGKLDADAVLTGTAAAPLISGRLAIRNGKFSEFVYERWDWTFHYADEQLSWKFSLQRNTDRNLTGDGYLPMNLSLTNTGDILYWDRPIRIQAATGGLDLAFLQAFTTGARKVQGMFVCDIKLENTLKDPLPLGFLRVVNGSFNIPQYGANYKDLQLVLTVDSSKISVVDFQLASGGGTLSAHGFATYDRKQGIQKGIEQTELDFSADNFLVASNKDFDVRIKGGAKVFGDLDNPRLSGNVTVLRSRFYLPAFEGAKYFEEERVQALLARAQADCTRTVTTAPIATSSSSTYYENLRGNIKIEIPRNTWLRSPELNVEIAGTIDYVKNGPDFEPFGTIQVVRGTYDLPGTGTRFDIQSGTLTFQGGIDYNPEIDIQTRHVFRSADQEKRTLILNITGQAFNPNLKFTLDGTEIESTDAIAYLLFGRSADELTQGQKKQLVGEESTAASQQTGLVTGKTATSVLAGLVASQLSRTIGNQLNLDVIQFQGDKDWRQATIVLGKYITNDLFLSYERGFNIGENKTGTTDQVTFEYEVTRFLFLQAIKGDEKTTGFDVIWKFEK